MDDLENEVSSLPATMAEIFLALVAVVVMMLLALVPAIRAPGALAAPGAFDVQHMGLRLDGKTPMMLTAEATGLRLAAPRERLIELDVILDDATLAAALREAAANGDPILLVIQPRGQEAAFLFGALAGGLGIESVYQLRVDAGCRYLSDGRLLARCLDRTPHGRAS